MSYIYIGPQAWWSMYICPCTGRAAGCASVPLASPAVSCGAMRLTLDEPQEHGYAHSLRAAGVRIIDNNISNC